MFTQSFQMDFLKCIGQVEQAQSSVKAMAWTKGTSC